MFFSADGADNDNNDILTSSHMTKTFVSARRLLLVVNDEGEVVKDVCHLVADNNTGPSNIATACMSSTISSDMSIGW
jgi:hypothetical protein